MQFCNTANAVNSATIIDYLVGLWRTALPSADCAPWVAMTRTENSSCIIASVFFYGFHECLEREILQFFCNSIQIDMEYHLRIPSICCHSIVTELLCKRYLVFFLLLFLLSLLIVVVVDIVAVCAFICVNFWREAILAFYPKISMYVCIWQSVSYLVIVS